MDPATDSKIEVWRRHYQVSNMDLLMVRTGTATPLQKRTIGDAAVIQALIARIDQLKQLLPIDV